MGTAGLDLKKLVGLLEQIKIDCTLVEDDRGQDHCLLRLSSPKRPGVVGMLEYINQGIEPRSIGIKVEPPLAELKSDHAYIGQHFSITDEVINLRGSIREDPQKIFEIVKRSFLGES